MSKTERFWSQEKIRKENRSLIINTLIKEPLTFKELTEKTNLSRAVINAHLKSLLHDGLIEKKYQNGKLLNVIKLSNLNLVDWFLNQLNKYDIPSEIIEAGKSKLTEDVVSTVGTLYLIRVFSSILLLNKIDGKRVAPTKIEKSKTHASTLHVYSNKLIPEIILDKKIINTVESLDHENNMGQKKDKKPEVLELETAFKKLLNELTPYTFHIGLEIFNFEKSMIKYDSNKNELEAVFVSPGLTKKTFNSLEVASEWWYNNVVSYLPGLQIIELLTLDYFNRILQHSKELSKALTSKDVTVVYLEE